MLREPHRDEEGYGLDEDFARFGEDDATWRWVVDVYWDKNHVRSVRVPNRKEKTLVFVIAKYVTAESGIHIH